MALRIYMDNRSYVCNAIHLVYWCVVCMSNLFDNISDETFAGWLNHKNSKQLWLEEMEQFWLCTASEETACKKCVYFDEQCEASHADECPEVISEFNLDNKHFN